MASNSSGLLPVEYKILVKLDSVADKTAGGIIIPIALVEKEKMAQEQATLIAVGGNSFDDFKDPVPKVGDRVYVAKHAGYRVKGIDGEKYQLMNDKDIAAIIGG